MSKNTLFNYFTKTPPAAKKAEPTVTPDSSVKCNGKLNGTPVSSKKGRPEKKVPEVSHDDEEDQLTDHEEEELASPVKKRRRILMVDSDDSDDEYKPGKKDLEASESEELSEHESPSSEEPSEDEEVSTPKRKRRPDRKQNAKKPRNGFGKPNGHTPTTRSIIVTTPPPSKASPPSTPASTETKSKLALFAAKQTLNEKAVTTPEVGEDGKTWSHLTYKFLQPNHIMDANRRRPDHLEYNPRTLYVPEDFKRNLTPAMRQWWEIKSHHFDCVLFFKVGKFYELYHMDAVVGVNELNISFMRGEFAHSGFPEIAYSRFAPLLVEKGYQVARVEQTETPNLMEERCKTISRPTKFDRVVKRELCQITTKGTRTFNVADGDACGVAGSHFLLSLTEKSVGAGATYYGVCFVDTTIGSFYIGQFEDDRHCSRLRTLMARYPPVQILYERGALSPKTQLLLSSPSCPVPPGLQSSLFPGTEFWDASKTLKALMDGNYFISEKNDSKITSGPDYWPPAIRSLISEDDTLGLTPRNDSELAIQCLGGLTWYLQRCCIDQQLFSMRTFQVYTPVDLKSDNSEEEETYKFGSFMVLDGITIENLDLLSDSDCSLVSRLNHCCTAFGQRLLRQWVSAPLCEIKSIKLRQQAIEWLLAPQGQKIAKEAKEKLAGLPDLERMLSAIHSQGNEAKSKTHPDSRAIFYEDKIYSKRKINDFLATLGGFKTLANVAEIFEGEDCMSKLLLKLTHTKETSPLGMFPDLKPVLKFFDEAFNHDVAKQEGRIIPIHGVDAEYDAALEDIAEVQEKVNEHLKEQREIFKCKVTYFGTERKRYQIEVPDSACKYATDDHCLQSQRKGFKRYYTSEGKELLEQMMSAEDRKAAALRDLSRRIFAQFSKHNIKWAAAVECIATLDVLMSLAEHTRSQEGETCLPEFFQPSSKRKPFISIQDGRHPCILLQGGFIPNDIHIGPPSDGDAAEDKTLILVTGPNMGGKSTLMRLAGLITIMAQMGCHVPATSCQLTPADRIFTRLGANDRIGEGESTFCVEMSETASILRHATPHSLVLVDELGRGTATYDGTAIAAAVVRELASMGCRTLFSTHYHSLVTEFGKSAGVALGHMACMVETDDIDEDNEEGGDEGQERVTFLYKFTPGACPKSYGFHVARLAGIPKSVISSALKAAREMETKANAKKLIRALCSLSVSDSHFKDNLSQALECS
ncbi:DNA mismatch repair protein Msh6 [Ischnura elegans]|uniref:DNA mismatch repair protein Msh6 n=1 Tax=Ischnura elegans TaxID=197161 RepID=UPI001ED86CDA|nr:DNA mismatch repair protein Msh6 [Ischnura elegans]